MQRTKIEYLTHSWSPIAMKCTPVSAGCANCWHLAMAKRLANNSNIRQKRRDAYSGGPVVLDHEELEAPLHVKKPARIAIQLMGDLFHDSIPFDWIDTIMATVTMADQHTFLALTKRPKRMQTYFSDMATPHRIQRQLDAILIRRVAQNSDEEWREVVGYEGLYRVSNKGKVMSFKGRWEDKEHPLKGTHKDGYITVSLSKNKLKTRKYVHAVMLEAFVGPPGENEEGCHFDGNRDHNVLENLRWGTKKENHSDSARHGKAGTWMKSRADFTQEEISDIRDRWAHGQKLYSLAFLFDSTIKQIWKIVHLKTYKPPEIQWPIVNLMLGVSVEDQKTADERIPILLQIPAAKRFVSVEPVLGPIDVSKWLNAICCYKCGGPLIRTQLAGCHTYDCKQCGPDRRAAEVKDCLDWVILGGETGSGARPMELEWARSIVNQCHASGVPVFVKQLTINGKISKKMEEWPEDLRVREIPDGRQ